MYHLFAQVPNPLPNELGSVLLSIAIILVVLERGVSLVRMFYPAKVTNGHNKGFDPHAQPSGSMSVVYWEEKFDEILLAIGNQSKSLDDIKRLLERVSRRDRDQQQQRPCDEP